MSYKVVQADLMADKARMLAFWSEHHPKPLERKFQWMYENNPCGRTRAWLLLHGDTDQLVGMGAMFPRQFVADGQCYEAGVLGDLLVHKAHRSLGPALQLQKTILQLLSDGEVALLYGLPNRASEFVFQRIGYQRLGTMRRLVKVICSKTLLGRIKLPSFVQGLIAPVLDVALFLTARETWRSTKRYAIHEDYSVFDERFDALWRSKEAGVHCALRRSAAYMTWKFRDDPDDVNHVFALCAEDDTRLLGCIIYAVNGRTVEIREFIAADEAADDLMTLFLKKVRAAKPVSVVVNTLDDSVVLRSLKRFRFWAGAAGRSVYYGTGSQLKDRAAEIAQTDRWLLMKCDEDT
ncbi:MAG: GNAT family N-acetyltransferase [Pseudomonadota bacterium]